MSVHGIHERGGKRWACLPGRPMIDADEVALRDEKGKIRYVAPLRWTNPELARQFSKRLVTLIRATHRGALDGSPP